MKNIEELLPEDLEKIDQEIKDHKAALFKFIAIQINEMRWGPKRSAKALRITTEDLKKLKRGEIDQWQYTDGLKMCKMIPCQMHLIIKPFFLGARTTPEALPIHVFPKFKKEKVQKEIAG